MARKIINLGASAGDHTGDTARSGGDKINENFEEVYGLIDILTRIDIITDARGFSISGTDLTVNADWQWYIDNELYTNPAAVVLSVALSSSGMVRKVYVVPNDANGFSLIEGDEAASNPPTPELPNGGMYVTFFEVSDSGIGTAADPYNGDNLINKLDKGSFYGTADDLIDKNTYSWTNVNTLSGVVVDYVNPYVGMSINFKDAVTELHSLSFPTIAKRPYFGALGFIKNSQSIDILIPHKELSLVANRYCFAFPDEQDLILKPNEILFFKADPDETHSFGYLDVICVYNNGTSTPLATDAISGKVKTDIEEADPVVYTKTTTDSLLGDKVDKDGSKVLSDNNYSTAEKNKLASIDATHYLAPLQTTVQLSAIPQADISDKARVYVEDELSDYFYDATASSGDVAPDDQAGGVGFWRKVAVGGETPTSIKTKYESNADTNALTDARAAKVDAIDQSVSSAEKATWNGKQDALGYTAENAANKSNDIEADKASTSKYGNIAAWIFWLKNYFFANLPAKATVIVDADTLALGDSEDGGKTKTRTFAQLLVTLGTRLATYFTVKDRLLENATVTGSFALDYSLYELWNLTLTGSTTFTESNLERKTILIRCTGNFALTFPSGWSTDITGYYVGTAQNLITVQYFKSGVYKVLITQPD